jgi:hypothetical protein
LSQTTRAQGTPLAIRMGDSDSSDVVSANLRAVPIGAVIIAIHGLLTWWRLSRSWFWQDDFNMLATAADRPLGSLLFSDYNGHLVPGSWLVAWVSDHVAAMSWAPVGAFLLLLVVATDVALLAALVRLFGRRLSILVPFTLFCTTTLTLSATVWWAAAMQWMPTTLGLALAVYFFAGYAERPNPRDLWGSLGAVALGLFFFEKAVAIPAVLALLAVLYFAPGPLWKRPWRAFRRYVVFWAAHLVLAAGYLWLYLTRADPEAVTSVQTQPGDYAELARNMILGTFVPGMVGGPLDWFATPDSSLASWSTPPTWLEWASWALALVVVVGSCVLVRGAWRAWALLGIFLAFSVALVARARLGVVGPFIGRDHRYLTDAALLGALCLALAVIPLRDGLDRAMRHVRDAAADGDPESWPDPDPDEDGNGPSYRSTATVPDDDADSADGDGPEDTDAEDVDDDVPQRQPSLLTQWLGYWRLRAIGRARDWSSEHRSWPLMGGVLVIALVTVGGLVSSEQFMKTWEQNPAPRYFANVEAGLRDPSRPKPVFMFDQAVPPLVMAPTFESGRMFSHVLKVYGDEAPVFGWWAPRFLVADGEGRLRPGRIAGPSATPPGSLACSAPTDPARGVSVVMPNPPPQWDWKVEITYSAMRDTPARVGYGSGPKVPVQLRKGLNVVVVAASGAGPAVSLTDLAQGAVVCVGKVAVGNPEPTPEKQPQAGSPGS